MPNRKILTVDDEPAILSIVKELLEDRYQVVGAKDGHEAVAAAIDHKPDLILLDNIMPGMTGLDVVRVIRKAQSTSHIPIIMVTALKDSVDRIEAYNAGVDDFISKPFHPEELIARIDARILRFKKPSLGENLLEVGNLKMDLDNFGVEINGKHVALTNIEFSILRMLLLNRNTIVSRRQIIDAVWKDQHPAERILDIHMATLRKKTAAFNQKIETIYRKGYIIRSET